MLKIGKRIEFDMGHCLTDVCSKCYSPHGHRYVLNVYIDGIVNANGMIMDFGEIKAKVKGWIDKNLDHAFMVSQKDSIRLDRFEFKADSSDSFLDDLELSGESVFTVQGEKMFITNFETTAENIVVFLSKVFEYILGLDVVRLELYETPNSVAVWETK